MIPLVPLQPKRHKHRLLSRLLELCEEFWLNDVHSRLGAFPAFGLFFWSYWDLRRILNYQNLSKTLGQLIALQSFLSKIILACSSQQDYCSTFIVTVDTSERQPSEIHKFGGRIQKGLIIFDYIPLWELRRINKIRRGSEVASPATDVSV